MSRVSDVRETNPRWWAVRPAQNRKPATYRCPLCGKHLPALSEHMLILPEGPRWASPRTHWMRARGSEGESTAESG